MSTSPRKRPASEALVAGGGRRPPDRHRRARLLERRGLDPVPAEGRNRRRAQEISKLYDIVFAIAVAIFVVVEGLIVWSILRYRRAPDRRRPAAADPRQQRRRGPLDAHPDRHRPVPVRDLVADPEHGRLHERRQRPEAGHPDPRHRRPVPVEVRVPRRGRQARRDADSRRSATAAGWPCPVGRKVYVTLRSPRRHPRLVRPAVPVQARRRARPGRTTSSSRSIEDEAGQIFHGQCAELCGTGHRTPCTST